MSKAQQIYAEYERQHPTATTTAVTDATSTATLSPEVTTPTASTSTAGLTLSPVPERTAHPFTKDDAYQQACEPVIHAAEFLLRVAPSVETVAQRECTSLRGIASRHPARSRWLRVKAIIHVMRRFKQVRAHSCMNDQYVSLSQSCSHSLMLACTLTLMHAHAHIHPLRFVSKSS